MTHVLVAIAFALTCAFIGLRSADRPAAHPTVGLLCATFGALILEAAVGLNR